MVMIEVTVGTTKNHLRANSDKGNQTGRVEQSSAMRCEVLGTFAFIGNGNRDAQIARQFSNILVR